MYIYREYISNLKQDFDELVKYIKSSQIDRNIFVLHDSNHVRLSVYLKKFIDQKVIFFDISRSVFEDNNLTISLRLRNECTNWLKLFFLNKIIADNNYNIINYSLSDLNQFPLRLLLANQPNIWFDCYDPYYYYTKNKFVLKLLIKMYSTTCSILARDLRIKKLLKIAKNNSSKICYLPDINVIPKRDLANTQFPKNGWEKIAIACSGHVSAYGDEGILETVKLIHSIIPNLEFHFCFSRNLDKKNQNIYDLVSYIEANDGFYLHQNLSGNEYLQVLDSCHFGLSLHDKYVFQLPYDFHTPEFLADCPSSRVNDYAARGLILMTTKDRKFQKRLFRNLSPHGIILDFHKDITLDDLINTIGQVVTFKDSKARFGALKMIDELS